MAIDRNKIVNIASSTNPIRAWSKISSNAHPIEGEKKKIVVSVHHKSGTVLLKKLFSNIALKTGLKIDFRDQYDFSESNDILFLNHTRVERPPVEQYVGCHQIRDPRDMVVSGYNYHLVSDEPWLHVPRERFEGKTYAQYLKGFDKEEGINREAKRFFDKDFQEMISWDYQNPNIYEIKYEDMILDPQAQFRDVLEFMKFKEPVIVSALKFLETQSLDKQQKSKHVLSGRPAAWKKHVTDKNVDYMKELFGEGLIKLGYEDSLDW